MHLIIINCSLNILLIFSLYNEFKYIYIYMFSAYYLTTGKFALMISELNPIWFRVRIPSTAKGRAFWHLARWLPVGTILLLGFGQDVIVWTLLGFSMSLPKRLLIVSSTWTSLKLFGQIYTISFIIASPNAFFRLINNCTVCLKVPLISILFILAWKYFGMNSKIFNPFSFVNVVAWKHVWIINNKNMWCNFLLA